MKKIVAVLSVCLLVTACKKTNEHVEVVTVDGDSAMVLGKDSVNAIPNDTTKVAINEDGPVYVSSSGEYRFRVLSHSLDYSSHKLLLKNEFSGRIYSMERLTVPNGEKYMDLDGNYFILKKDSFYFGNKTEVIAAGLSPKNSKRKK